MSATTRENSSTAPLSWRDGAAWLVVFALIYTVINIADEWRAPLRLDEPVVIQELQRFSVKTASGF